MGSHFPGVCWGQQLECEKFDRNFVGTFAGPLFSVKELECFIVLLLKSLSNF